MAHTQVHKDKILKAFGQISIDAGIKFNSLVDVQNAIIEFINNLDMVIDEAALDTYLGIADQTKLDQEKLELTKSLAEKLGVDEKVLADKILELNK